MIRTVSSVCLFLALMVVGAPVFAQTNPQQPIKAVTDEASIPDDATTALSPAPIGTVIVVEGLDNNVQEPGQAAPGTPLKNGDVIYAGDTIQSGANGKVLIVFLDDSRLTLGSKARMTVNDYVFDDSNDVMSGAHYNIAAGSFMYASGLLAKQAKPNVKIQTPYATMGVRGATLWAGILNDQYSVYVADGETALETNRGRIRMTNGEGVTIRSMNSIPERPAIWNSEKVDQAKAQITLRDLDAAKDKIAANRENQPAMISAHKEYLRSHQQNKIGQQKPRDSIKRLDNKSANTAASDDRATTPSIARIPQQLSTSRIKGEDMPPKAMNDISAPLPDAAKAPMEAQVIAPIPTPAATEETVTEAPAIEPEEIAPQPAEISAPPQTQPVEMGKDFDAPAFPTPAQTIQLSPENLPTDPAMRQEALEKLNLQNAPAPSTGTYQPL